MVLAADLETPPCPRGLITVTHALGNRPADLETVSAVDPETACDPAPASLSLGPGAVSPAQPEDIPVCALRDRASDCSPTSDPKEAL